MVEELEWDHLLQELRDLLDVPLVWACRFLEDRFRGNDMILDPLLVDYVHLLASVLSGSQGASRLSVRFH